MNSGPPALDSLGSKLSLVAWMDMFRIDIVVSDLAARDRRHAGKGKSKYNLKLILIVHILRVHFALTKLRFQPQYLKSIIIAFEADFLKTILNVMPNFSFHFRS